MGAGCRALDTMHYYVLKYWGTRYCAAAVGEQDDVRRGWRPSSLHSVLCTLHSAVTSDFPQRQLSLAEDGLNMPPLFDAANPHTVIYGTHCRHPRPQLVGIDHTYDRRMK